MRSTIFVYILSFLSLTSAVWIPLYDPCQIINANCVADDFKVDVNETTCNTVIRDEYGWDSRKGCIPFLQRCLYANEIEETKKVYNYIQCNRMSDATIDNPATAPYAYNNPGDGNVYAHGTIVYNDPDKGVIPHADGPIEAACKKWKVTQYCIWDGWHIIAAFIILMAIAIPCGYCVFGIGRKSDCEEVEDEKKEADKVLGEIGITVPTTAMYKKRIKRF